MTCKMYLKTKENNMSWYVRNSKERFMEVVRKTQILHFVGAEEKNKLDRTDKITP